MARETEFIDLTGEVVLYFPVVFWRRGEVEARVGLAERQKSQPHPYFRGFRAHAITAEKEYYAVHYRKVT